MTKEKLRNYNLNLPKFHELALPERVKDLIRTLTSENTDIYLIGGFVRDLILKRISCDLDFIVVDKNTVQLAKDLANKHDLEWFMLDETNQTVRVVLKDESSSLYTFDFTFVPKSGLEADFERRDFTINSLAINLKEPGKIIDKFSGLNDLHQKKIKAIHIKNLLDDPLRFLRAFRFAALLEGEIENDVLSFIKSNLNAFDDKVSPERISTELWKILDCEKSFKYLKQIAESGLLEKIIPEMTPMRKVTPNDFHHLWLFDHSLELVKAFEEHYVKIPSWAKEELNKPFGLLESPKKQAIAKLGSLLHDVGKPGTWEIKKIDGNEKHTFYGHDKLGSDITKQIGERLKFSNLIIETVSKLVRYHLRPFQLQQGNAPITEKALYRFFRDVSNDTPLLLILAIADTYATCGPKVTKDDLLKAENLILFLFDEYKKFQIREAEKAKRPKLLNGNEIMSMTGLKPTPELGLIMKELDELISIGEITSKEEAQDWVLKKVKN